MRFHSRAWLCRTNAPIPFSAVGAALAASRSQTERRIRETAHYKEDIPERRRGQAPALQRWKHSKQETSFQGGRPHGAAPTVENKPFRKMAGGASPSPTVFKRLFRDWVGDALGPSAVNRPSTVGSADPGAVVEPHRQQFLQTQGPVARRGFRPTTPFLRARDDVLLTSRVSPVMGSGESGPMDLGEAERSRSPSAASPAILWFLSHRWERNPPRRAEPCPPPGRRNPPAKTP